MSEDEITDNLDLMVESIRLVQNRFLKIKDAADFVGSTDGVVLLDAISMRLQVIFLTENYFVMALSRLSGVRTNV